MGQIHLDHLLDSASAPLPAAVRAEAERVGDATMPDRLRRARRPRGRWTVPVLVAASVALTAGASTTAIVMSHWGGVSMPIDNIRNEQPIRISWTTETGHQESCDVWIELRNPDINDRQILDAAIEARDWSGLGQRLYDAAPPALDDPDGESRVGDGLTPALQSFVSTVFPDIHWFSEGEATDERGVDAWGMTCDAVTTSVRLGEGSS